MSHGSYITVRFSTPKSTFALTRWSEPVQVGVDFSQCRIFFLRIRIHIISIYTQNRFLAELTTGGSRQCWG